MQAHIASVRSRRIAWDVREVVQHGLNADRVELALDAEWQQCDSIVAVLAKTGAQAFRVDASHGFYLPSALMEETGPLRMCLIGYAGDSLRVVTAKETAPLVVVESGETGGMDPTPEQPDLWAQLMEEVRKATDGAKTAAQSATRAEADLRAAAERGDFDGEDGKTPVRGVDYWTAEDRKPIEDATLAATTAAGRADAAAEKASVGEASRVAAEAERADAETARAKAEQAREIAETERVEAEATRAANETKRTESFHTNLVSWNSKVDAACKKATDTASKAAQDAKTATDAAIAKTEEATQAAVAKADKATASATTAANKAEAAVSKLPLPLGNTLKGEVESTMVSVHDAYPAPLVTTKVMGQSNQITTTGKNLMRLINSGTVNGVNLTANGDGSYHVKGTQTAGFTRFYTDDGVKKPLAEFGLKVGDTVYLSASEANSKLYVAVFFFDEKGSHAYTQVATSATATKYTITENVIQAYAVISLDGNAGTSVDSDFHPMISLSNNKDWEPYTGGKPSPSPEYPQEITNLNKAELVITGRNLVEQSTTSTNALNRFSSCLFVEADLMPSTNYVLSFNDVVGNGYYINDALFSNFHAFTTKSGRNVVKLSTKAEISKANTGQYVKQGWIILKNDKNQDKAPAFTDVQIELGDTETTYEPHQSKSTVIDLKGNELLSIPNGVRDEVVIDAEGNVSLIKRVAKYVVPEDVYAQDESNNFGVQLKLNAVDDKYLHKQLCPENATYSPDVNWLTVFKEGNSWANLQEFKQWFIGTEFYYGTNKPQTIPLGKVELPALPEATSNVWNDGNIPANVYINYLKDVNIAFADLESKLTQAVVAAAANV